MRKKSKYQKRNDRIKIQISRKTTHFLIAFRHLAPTQILIFVARSFFTRANFPRREFRKKRQIPEHRTNWPKISILSLNFRYLYSHLRSVFTILVRARRVSSCLARDCRARIHSLRDDTGDNEEERTIVLTDVRVRHCLGTDIHGLLLKALRRNPQHGITKAGSASSTPARNLLEIR